MCTEYRSLKRPLHSYMARAREAPPRSHHINHGGLSTTAGAREIALDGREGRRAAPSGSRGASERADAAEAARCRRRGAAARARGPARRVVRRDVPVAAGRDGAPPAWLSLCHAETLAEYARAAAGGEPPDVEGERAARGKSRLTTSRRERRAWTRASAAMCAPRSARRAHASRRSAARRAARRAARASCRARSTST